MVNVMFNETVLEHFRNPHNVGEIPDATAVVEVVNPVCGDVLQLSVRLEAGRVVEARFKTQGCVAAIASSSVLTDLLAGKLPSEFLSITSKQISEALGTLPPSTFHAAKLCGDALSALFLKLV
jgi:nitrogen fixation NifU-like protein